MENTIVKIAIYPYSGSQNHGCEALARGIARELKGNTVGINCSPLVVSCEKEKGIVLQNYIKLIQWILKNTKMNIALIPHVVWNQNDDRSVLQYIARQFKKNKKRLCVIEDCNCMELKAYISQLRFLVCARTHASIAAYSSCVPTLVVGYSVKSKGIAKDLFGTYDNYVISAQELQNLNDLSEKFLWIYEHGEEIKKRLKLVLPSYLETVANSGKIVKRFAASFKTQSTHIQITDKKQCCGCYACENICPTNALLMSKDAEGFMYPKIDLSRCISCGKCEVVCPMCKMEQLKETFPVAYGATSKDPEIVSASSSGGIFSLLAQEVIDEGGFVFGACFNEKKEVVHSYTNQIKEIERFRTSKYSQSIIGDTYRKVKELLDKDNLVYFSGTPCQVYGLKLYLGKEYSNLILQDLICHGNPSPLVLKKYLEYIEKENGEKIDKINFRDKRSGWYNYKVSFSGKERSCVQHFQENIYMQLFLKNYSLRPSCYSCHFKGIQRISDITLGDFWGIENVYPDFSKNRGVTLVILQSKRGERLFGKIKANVIYKEAPLPQAVLPNVSMYRSPNQPQNRNCLFENLEMMDFKMLVEAILSNKIPYDIEK